MKKLLSVLLAVIMVFSTLTAIIAIPAAADGFTATAEAGGYIIDNGDGRLTARAYYGNTFLGWYNEADEVVSYAATIKAVDENVVAKFNNYNLIPNGNFEDADISAYSSTFTAKEEGDPAVTVEVKDAPGANAGHGDKALYVDSTAVQSTAMNHALKLPTVTLEKNTTYVLRYSAYAEAYEGNKYFYTTLQSAAAAAQAAAAEKGYYNYSYECVVPSYSFRWAAEAADGTTPAPSAWCYLGKEDNTGKLTGPNTHYSVGVGHSKWIDIIFLFNTGDDLSMFAEGENEGEVWFNVAVGNDDKSKATDPETNEEYDVFTDNSPNFYIDNVSLTKVSSEAKAQMEVTAAEGGSVTGPAVANKGAFEMPYFTTGGSAKGEGGENVAQWYVADSTPAQAQMVTTGGVYTAVAEEGYAFDKWVDDAGNTLSTDAAAYLAAEGKVTALFKSTGATATDGGFIKLAGDDLVAIPYYGNTFDGWYVGDEKVSSSYVFDGEVVAGLTAKFNAYNLVADGNFESGEAVDYETTLAGSTAEVKDVPAGSHAVHGNKALYVTSDGPTLSTAAQYLLKIPATLEKNTEYIFSFSYYIDGVANGGPEDAVSNATSGIAYVYFQSEAGFKNNWTASGVLADWSIVWENEAADAGVFAPGAWRYKGAQNKVMGTTTHASVSTGVGKWVDVYVKFNTGADASMFAEGADQGNFWFTVGNTYDDVNGKKDSSSNFYIDNIVIAKTAETEKEQTVSCGENGKIESATTPKAPVATYSYATDGGAKGDKYDVHAQGNLKYAQAVVTTGTFTAVAEEGYVFDGWYAGDELVSANATETFYTEEKVEARFKKDPNKVSNIITNGDFSEGGYKEATGNADKDTPIGWYDLSAQYANAKIHYPHTWDIAAGSYTNYSPSNVMGINSWQTAVQNIVLEAGKTYKVSAKMTMNAGTAIQENRSISIGIDAGVDMEAHSLDFSKPWVARKNLEFMTTTKKDGVTAQTWAGDFTDHTFTFNADDFIAANNIEVDKDGKFHARFVFVNDCTGWAEIDDVSIFEAVPVETKVEAVDGIYGGYVTGDTAGVKGKTVTFTAVAYEGNTFAGWYANDELVSTDATVTVTVEEGLSYTAKFNVNNLWPDSGYENLALGTNLLWNDGAEDNAYAWFSEQTSIYWHAAVTNEKVADGAHALKLTHRNNGVYAPVTVEANTDYVLSFDWLIKTMTMGSKPEEQRPTYLSDVVIKDAYGITIAHYALNKDNTGAFQNTEVFFNSGDNEEILVDFRYYAGSDCIYFDNFALVEGTADDTYVKVTYDSADATVGSIYEYVKVGTEYTVKNHEFRVPVAKLFKGYTYGETTFDFADDVADVITVGTEDIVLTAIYDDYVSDKMSDETAFNPDDYDYTFVVLPDEQNVNERYPAYYSDITQWIVDNKDLYNIKGAISVGDITQAASYTEWARAYRAYMLLEEAGIPFALTPGNHDYDFGISHGTPNDQTVRRNDYLNYYFNRDTVDYTNYVTCPVTGDSLINSYYTVEGVNEKFLIMALEIFPRDEVLAWASEVVAAHPDYKVIAATHSHIFSDGSYATDYDKYPINYPEDSNSAEEVIEKFITKHENIVLYLCGHSSSDVTLNIPIIGDNGNTVYQILTDTQNVDKNEKGVGMLTLIGVNETTGKMGFTNYSTLQGKYFLTDSNEFTIDYKAPAHEHEYNVPASDDTHHWNECSCGEFEEKFEHEFEAAADDADHWTECECGKATEKAPHVFDDEYDADCDCGYEREVPTRPVQNGWVDVDGTWYFYENGVMVTNEWRKDSVGWCYLLEDGRMATNMWLPDSKGWCYIEADGYCATNCWKKDSVGWIWLDGEGSMTKNAWVEDGGKWYYLDHNGYMVVNSWMADSIGWVYVGGDGAMVTNQWVMDSVGWCYVGADGYAMTNCWMADSIGWCYLDAEGRMVVNDYVYDSNGKCYLDESGYWDGKYL